ncbi:hypothetical protein RND81_02G018400 [Saponaria officinalis]|uniref:Uncharacterized protein n=1 Tax=Saponaria officinalis TaxID=3572 RepID=A0AAW1MPA3_SAPOF
MSIKVIKSTMVFPDEKTPRQSLWLSRLDMMQRPPESHTRVLFIYHSNNDVTNSTTFFDIEIMKGALSKALVPYYPLAGRLRINENSNRIEIDCNDEGVLFIEAETAFSLDDLGDGSNPNYNLRKDLIPTCDCSKGISSFPLLMIQITRFKCGGVTFGLASNHHVSDGFADMLFVDAWASLARGVEPSIVPCHDRAKFFGPRDPPLVNFKHLEYEPPLPPLPPKSVTGETSATREQHFKLSEDQISALKLKAVSDESVGYKVSTFKAIAAHVWRSVCKARGLADDQDVKLYINTDGRFRLKDPSFPQGYFGNAIFFSCVVAKAGDIAREPLFYTVDKIDEAVKKMDNPEYLRSAVDYLESQEDVKPLIRGPHWATCPNFEINSWAKFRVPEVDFGWGGPKSNGHGEVKNEGQAKIFGSLDGDKSTYVGIRLFSSHMDLFTKYFYDF